MNREELYKQELAKLEELFKDVEPIKARLTEGLRQEAAFLLAENAMLKQHMRETGMVKVHPEYPEVQKAHRGRQTVSQECGPLHRSY